MSDRYKGAILSPTAPTVTPQSAGGIYTSSQQLQYQGQGVWPTAFNNPINNSLRFRASASAYLNRTPASAGNRKTMTFSFWVKRGLMSSTQQNIISAGTGADNYIAWSSTNDYIEMNFRNGGSASNVFLITTQVFRDPSAWYHIVLAIDTTQATAANRVKLYVNGSQVTAFSTTNYPTQNNDLNTFGNNVIQYIGQSGVGGFNFYLDGYLTEVYYIDGQALTPSSFGTTDAYGVWQPIPYTGTYGNNGFYLPFTDNSALTTSSNVGLGKDFSGNGNYWTTNNISITAGATYDSMKDVPTNTNSNTANYCVLNPLAKGSSISITAGNLNAGSSGTYGVVLGTIGVSSGKYYWEVLINSTAGANCVGLADANTDLSSYLGKANNFAYINSGGIYGPNDTLTQSGLATFTTNDVIGVALDMDARELKFYKNNTFVTTVSSLSATTWFPAVADNSAGSDLNVSVNFGQRPFSYTPPSGFYPLNTYNLSTPTILAGNQYMDISLYTGNGANPRTPVSNLNFAPDFVWIKDRSSTPFHNISDSVRGVSKIIQSNTTTAEQSAPNGGVSAFNSNGFTIQGSSTVSDVNQNGDAFVAWQWKANGTGVTNTNGTITTTVSANTTAGFSIVTYTGTGSNATIGHGLGVPPKVWFWKNRSATADWSFNYYFVYNSMRFVFLNTTAAQGNNSSSYWGNPPTATVNYIGGPDASTNVNGDQFVMYAFAEVAGYSKISSYTGNGSADGPFVFCGFRPRYVLFKRIDAIANWTVRDTARNPYNSANLGLFPNLSNAEDSTAGREVDILSNGFKIRGTDSDLNTNGGTYIYMAFAENPFKISRAR